MSVGGAAIDDGRNDTPDETATLRSKQPEAQQAVVQSESSKETATASLKSSEARNSTVQDGSPEQRAICPLKPADVQNVVPEDESSDDTAPPSLKTSEPESSKKRASLDLGSSFSTVTFVRGKKGWSEKEQYKLRNSLLAGVGLLELANAGDFAANIWNDIPVLNWVKALMIIGGTTALMISVFAFLDARLALQNIHRLREERFFLLRQRRPDSETTISRSLDCQLDVNRRELGTETIDRLGMDIFMGFGAVMVGVGTLLAPGGANPRIFRASNLLSGYIGNSPVAFYGLVNACFSVYLWRRASRHRAAAAKELNPTLKQSFQRRVRRVKTHTSALAVTGIVGGAASLVTSTNWAGYPFLVLCIISSVVCNYMWRHRIGYERSLYRQSIVLDKIALIEELEQITSFKETLERTPTEALPRFLSRHDSFPVVLNFLKHYGMFEDFCSLLVNDETLAISVLGVLGHLGSEVNIDDASLLAADKELYPQLCELAQDTLHKMGTTRLRYRERYVLEALGCYLSSSGSLTEDEKC